MDAQIKKTALRLFTYGLYIGTSGTGADVAAGTINWVSQASFQPPLVMAAVKADSHLHQLIETTGQFAINVLSADQKEIAQDFFRPTKQENNTLNGHPYESGSATGVPLLTELPAWVEVKVTDTVKRGDHTVFIGEVIDAGIRDENAKALDMWNTGWFYAG
ncbi:flavin reductase family protein [Sulfobacillus harzensis]|uniref:Flavin reductase family protein n=1 Tax=Sulfobacillus harzensis TaxID=2729629 RepID=A0A7Y0L4U3_9FIRM|nr:flavin reductase family protein [Sulfobacillus harzensis]NMP22706.1 flavin reductase family protein [Sulfobacillus harzensis]